MWRGGDGTFHSAGLNGEVRSMQQLVLPIPCPVHLQQDAGISKESGST